MGSIKPAYSSRAIAEGAAMAAVTVVLALAGTLVPLLEPAAMLIWTLPTVAICVRHGMRAGGASLAVAGVVIMVVTSPIHALEMLLLTAGPALVVGYGFRHSWRTEIAVLFTAMASAIGLLADIGLSALLTGARLGELFTVDAAYVDELVASFMQSGFLGSSQSSAAIAASVMETMTVVFALLPGILVVFCLCAAYANCMLARRLLRKLQMSLPPITKLAAFRLPIGCVFGFCFGYGLMVTANMASLNPQPVITFGENIRLVFLALYFYQGLGFVAFFMEKAPAPVRPFIKWILVLVVFLSNFWAIPVLCYAGLADALMDFRKLDAPPAEESEDDIPGFRR